jgi:hypothetical protein
MSAAGKAERLRGRLSIDPDAVAAPSAPQAIRVTPAPTSTAEKEKKEEEVAPEVAAAGPALEPVQAEPADEKPKPNRPASKITKTAAVSAVDDPTILEGRRDYRSFYVEDTAFARFRAAIFWLSRREDAAGDVPDNMSAAVQLWMAATATELEQRYNDGQPFRMPPGQRRRRSTSKS